MKNPNTKLGKIHVILPAYNEAESLPNLLNRFVEFDNEHPDLEMEIRVIDDGCTDDTAKIAMQPYGNLDIEVIKHEKNMGLGQAMLTGVQVAAEKCGPLDVIVAMDADDTHEVKLIENMYNALQNGADIAIASRFVEGASDASAPPFRRLLSRGASVVFRTVFPLEKIGDFTSGYRMYRASLIKEASRHWGDRLIEEEGFACMVELLLKLRHWKPKITEVPMVLHYDRKLSTSKLRLMATLGQYLMLALRNKVTPPPRLLHRPDAAYSSQ